MSFTPSRPPPASRGRRKALQALSGAIRHSCAAGRKEHPTQFQAVVCRLHAAARKQAHTAHQLPPPLAGEGWGGVALVTTPRPTSPSTASAKRSLCRQPHCATDGHAPTCAARAVLASDEREALPPPDLPLQAGGGENPCRLKRKRTSAPARASSEENPQQLHAAARKQAHAAHQLPPLLAGEGWGGVGRPAYFPVPGSAVHCFSHAFTVSCHSTLLCGFSTQWFSSGKVRNSLGMPRRCSAVNAPRPWLSGMR